MGACPVTRQPDRYFQECDLFGRREAGARPDGQNLANFQWSSSGQLSVAVGIYLLCSDEFVLILLISVADL